MSLKTKIIACSEINNNSRKCSRDKKLPSRKRPLLQKKFIKNRIMLITQAPSKQAHLTGNLNNINNDFFKRMIELIGINEKEFQKKVYWTHYCKCYPGKGRGGDKIPNQVCAKKYLKDEISLIKPSFIILMGRLVIKWLLHKTLKESIQKTLQQKLTYNVGITPVIATLHFSKAAQGYRKKYHFSETLRLIKKAFSKA